MVIPLPHCRIELVGFNSNTNGRSCPTHSCCGVSLVEDHPTRCEGQVFRLRLVPSTLEGDTSGTHLALHFVLPDGTDGCRVGFARRRYAITHGPQLDGRFVRLVEVYHLGLENSSKRAEYRRNHGFAIGEVLEDGNKHIKTENTTTVKGEHHDGGMQEMDM